MLRKKIVAGPLAISLALVISLVVSGCTTVGTHDFKALKANDFGEAEEIRFCILADEGVTEDESRALMAEVGEEFSLYGLKLKVPWVRPWARPAFLAEGIMRDVLLKSLEPPCDRLLVLVGRNFGDFLFGLLGVEVLGSVDAVTYTRGYVVARTSSLNQVFMGPTQVAIHESYHLLGCVHELRLSGCYARIRELKRIKRANLERGNDFFPSLSAQGEPIIYRRDADAWIHGALRRIQSAQAEVH